MDNTIDYEFASTGGGDATGLNDPVSTPFKSNICLSLARESLQNIIDAKIPGSAEPARAEFKLYQIRSQVLPNWKKLKQIFLACKDSYSNQPDTCNFFQTAADKLRDNTLINVMKISDFNTSGMTGGDDDEDGNYFSFLKAVGSSSKAGGKGGSFGLGKGAYFISSGFRMIFVSSSFSEGCMFQGKLRLASHLWEGDRRQGNGSWGLEKQKPIRQPDLVPPMFVREEQGTDIYVVNFIGSDQWEAEIIKSTLDNFWNAIFRRLITIKVSEIEINDENLDEMLHKYYSDDDLDSRDFPNPLPYYHAYMNATPTVATLPILGEVKLFIEQQSNYPKKIALLRKNGMTIERKRYDFVGNFSGVFICENERGNEVLRRMENEQHTEWKAANARGTEEEVAAKQAEKELKEFIRGVLDSIKPSGKIKSLSIPDLEKYLFLPGEDPDNSPSGTEDSEDINGSTRETGVEIGSEITQPKEKSFESPAPVINVTVVPGSRGGEQPVIHEGSGHERGQGGGNPDGGEESVKQLNNISSRTFAQKNDNNGYSHILLLKGPKNTHCQIEVKAGTEESLDKVSILAATDMDGMKLGVKENRVVGLTFNDKGSLKLKLILDGRDKYSLNITAYEIR